MLSILKTCCRSIKDFLLQEASLPDGTVTTILFSISLFSYFILSPHYGLFQAPSIFYEGASILNVAVLSGFIHANLSHLAGNMCFLVPLMLIIEKRLGPLRLVILYMLTSVGATLMQYHMVGGFGAGSSTVLFGLAPVAVLVLVKGWPRLVLLPALTLFAMECAKWWLNDGVGHVAHLVGFMLGLVYYLSICDDKKG